jgi:hypothetical protein
MDGAQICIGNCFGRFCIKPESGRAVGNAANGQCVRSSTSWSNGYGCEQRRSASLRSQYREPVRRQALSIRYRTQAHPIIGAGQRPSQGLRGIICRRKNRVVEVLSKAKKLAHRSTGC